MTKELYKWYCERCDRAEVADEKTTKIRCYKCGKAMRWKQIKEFNILD